MLHVVEKVTFQQLKVTRPLDKQKPFTIFDINMQQQSDHYQYLRTLLPPIPHVIERLSFTDPNSWGCNINLALLTSTDCLKWLSEFQEITKTEWKIEKSLTTAGTNGQSISWGVIYRCTPPQHRGCNSNQKYTTSVHQNSRDCTARLEMKITTQQQQSSDVKTHNKQYPCTVNIHFCHNHKTIGSIGGVVPNTSTYTSIQRCQSDVNQHHTSNIFNTTACTVDSTNNQRQPLLQASITTYQPQGGNSSTTTNTTAAASSTSFNHIQELQMNDTYMLNALTEAAVATRTAASTGSIYQPQRANLQSGMCSVQ